MRVITVCGMGFGTSLMLLMTIKDIGKKHHVAVEGEAVADVPVLSVTNLLDKKGIEEMILPYMK